MDDQPFLLRQMDATEFLLSLEPGSVDLIVTDPAYASLEKHRAKGTTTRLKVSDGSSNVWFPVVENAYFVNFLAACYQALKKNAHLYFYCDKETMFVVKPMAEAVGFKWHNIITWDKMKIGMGYHYRSRCEYVLFFEKGKRKLSDLGMPNVFDWREDPKGFVLECERIRNGYPTEKPVGVSNKLITQSSEPGDLVVDPFMGSASVGEAALRLGRRFMGSDVADLAMRTAVARLDRVADEVRRERTAADPQLTGA